MPKNKDLKRLTRERMQKTGEAYTTARAALLAKRKREVVAAARPDTKRYPQLAGMSDEAVAAKTGRTWEEWVTLLDGEEAAARPHREIARIVREGFQLSSWWSQTVTVGYERIKGLREIGQRRDGAFEANKSKTLAVPIGKLYRAFSVKKERERWLPEVGIAVRTSARDKSIRWTWPDGTSVHTHFTAKSPEKSQVAVQHTKLPSQEDASRMKAYWSERLNALAELLEPARSRTP